MPTPVGGKHPLLRKSEVRRLSLNRRRVSFGHADDQIMGVKSLGRFAFLQFRTTITASFRIEAARHAWEKLGAALI